MAPTRKRTSGTTYQVFLSFRGPDTHQGFTDVLYYALIDAGIRVFRDDEEIRKGEDIGEEILRAIEESRIFVPIFSINYASTLLIHREKFSTDIVHQWEEALRKAEKIEGWELKGQGYGEFARSFVREVSMRLKVKHKYVTDYLVQRDDQVKDLMDLLDIESSGVCFVGIHEMGGIGKTTLAKLVFNKLCDRFDKCSFLADVRRYPDLKYQALQEGGGEPPKGSLGWAIDTHFSSLEALVQKMSAEGAALQGSGWVDPLVTKGPSLVPLIGIDVWEHVYYLQYKNVRPDYLKNIWKISFDIIAISMKLPSSYIIIISQPAIS
ncbi:hypothetical protein CRG98_033450 [Punica granatum]|uniref:TIR domain-containing protein n=1 Tax=Punica granatum TaxID=22663 RepID=A0A2I0IQA7_PUNGR|nr:hypothetical protein CRG98_033450 [Punica granatum]